MPCHSYTQVETYEMMHRKMPCQSYTQVLNRLKLEHLLAYRISSYFGFRRLWMAAFIGELCSVNLPFFWLHLLTSESQTRLDHLWL